VSADTLTVEAIVMSLDVGSLRSRFAQGKGYILTSVVSRLFQTVCGILANKKLQDRFMGLFSITIAALIISLFAAGAHAQSPRQHFTVLTPGHQVLVESLGACANATCPAVVILSGSKGFSAPVYDEIGQTFRAAGLNAYLVHVLSPADLGAIATASGARARIAHYAQRLPDWISAVQGVAAYLKGNRATAARSVFSESPLARKSLRPPRSGVPLLTH
jgi:hypothetical protein